MLIFTTDNLKSLNTDLPVEEKNNLTYTLSAHHKSTWTKKFTI